MRKNRKTEFFYEEKKNPNIISIQVQSTIRKTNYSECMRNKKQNYNV